jgi:hypothetical protein
MSSTSSFVDKSLFKKPTSSSQLDDAEKGILDNSNQLPIIPPTALTREALSLPLTKATPSPTQGVLTPHLTSATTLAQEEKPQPATSEKPSSPPRPPARNTRKRTKFALWFNPYRQFFTFCVTLNGIGIVLAAVDKFPYARNHLGALILGNLLMAILVRNELFGRFLYLIAIYGLRRVSSLSVAPTSPFLVLTHRFQWSPLWLRLGVTSALQHLGGIHSGCAVSGTA